MKLIPTLILTVSAALLLPATIHAEDAKAGGPGGKRGPGGPGGNPEERLKTMTEKLGLTEEQQGKIKDIFAKDAPQIRELLAKGRQNLSDDERTKLRDLGKAQMEQVAAVLTPEQKEKWKEARGPRGERRGKGGAAKTPSAT
jgi:Spy/CpxP family protein refolding chaperone